MTPDEIMAADIIAARRKYFPEWSEISGGDWSPQGYERRVIGVAGHVIVLTVSRWQNDTRQWYATARIECYGRHSYPLWGSGRANPYPFDALAMKAAEAWLTEWIAGWMGDMHCSGADLVADLDICVESLTGTWVGPFCGLLAARDIDLSAEVLHYPYGVLMEECIGDEPACNCGGAT